MVKKIAHHVIDTLKQQPTILGLLIINVIFVGFLVYVAHTLNERNTIERKALQDLVKQCFDRSR